MDECDFFVFSSPVLSGSVYECIRKYWNLFRRWEMKIFCSSWNLKYPLTFQLILNLSSMVNHTGTIPKDCPWHHDADGIPNTYKPTEKTKNCHLLRDLSLKEIFPSPFPSSVVNGSMTRTHYSLSTLLAIQLYSKKWFKEAWPKPWNTTTARLQKQFPLFLQQGKIARPKLNQPLSFLLYTSCC